MFALYFICPTVRVFMSSGNMNDSRPSVELIRFMKYSEENKKTLYRKKKNTDYDISNTAVNNIQTTNNLISVSLDREREKIITLVFTVRNFKESHVKDSPLSIDEILDGLDELSKQI